MIRTTAQEKKRETGRKKGKMGPMKTKKKKGEKRKQKKKEKEKGEYDEKRKNRKKLRQAKEVTRRQHVGWGPPIPMQKTFTPSPTTSTPAPFPFKSAQFFQIRSIFSNFPFTVQSPSLAPFDQFNQDQRTPESLTSAL